MSHETGPTRGQRDDDVERRVGLAQHPDGKEGAANRPDDGMDRVPGRIDPRHFIGEKFQDVEGAGDPEDEGLAQDGERLVFGREHDPVLVNGETGDEDRQVEIDSGEAGQTERDTEEVKPIHSQIMRSRAAKSRGFGAL